MINHDKSGPYLMKTPALQTVSRLYRGQLFDILEVTLSFQWKLEPQALSPLYYLLGEEGYDDAFVRFARAAIINTCRSKANVVVKWVYTCMR